MTVAVICGHMGSKGDRPSPLSEDPRFFRPQAGVPEDFVGLLSTEIGLETVKLGQTLA